jgi:hypothetical protein
MVEPRRVWQLSTMWRGGVFGCTGGSPEGEVSGAMRSNTTTHQKRRAGENQRAVINCDRPDIEMCPASKGTPTERNEVRECRSAQKRVFGRKRRWRG